MKLRRSLEPDMKTAETYYPEILAAILKYTGFCDEHGDEDLTEYKKLENQLHLLTGKDISKFNLSEWWEEEGAAPLAFKISLPDPLIVEGISREELTEIVSRLKSLDEPNEEDQSFYEQFRYYLDSFYHALLAANFSRYDRKLFQRNKDKSGNFFEYSIDEIVEKMWEQQP